MSQNNIRKRATSYLAVIMLVMGLTIVTCYIPSYSQEDFMSEIYMMCEDTTTFRDMVPFMEEKSSTDDYYALYDDYYPVYSFITNCFINHYSNPDMQEALQYFISRGPDLNYTDKKCKTSPFYYTMMYAYPADMEFTRILISLGANPYMRNNLDYGKEKISVLDYMIQNYDITQLEIYHNLGYRLDSTWNGEISPLEKSVAMDDNSYYLPEGIPEFLLTHDYDPNMRLFGGTYSLFEMFSFSDQAGLLVDKGLDVNQRCPVCSNETLLHRMARTGNSDLAELLIRSGADINATDINGRTPLMWSIREGQIDFAYFLVELGADKSLRDNSSKTAADYGKKMMKNDPDLAELLSY